jgi:hypothetical protein
LAHKAGSGAWGHFRRLLLRLIRIVFLPIAVVLLGINRGVSPNALRARAGPALLSAVGCGWMRLPIPKGLIICARLVPAL